MMTRLMKSSLTSIFMTLLSISATQAKVEGETIILGSAISTSGAYASHAVHAINGYNIAVERINATGGILVAGRQYKLKVAYYDDASTPARTGQMIERMIKQDGVQYLLGPYGSATTQAAAAVAEKYQVPIVAAQGASGSLFSQTNRYLFGVLSSSDQYLASAIDLIAETVQIQGREPSSVKVAMAYEDSTFAQDVRAGVGKQLQKYGMKFVIDDKLPPKFPDMSSTLAKVKALKPDLLLVFGRSKGATTATDQIAKLKIEVPMIAMTHCESAKLISKFNDAANDILCATQWAETLTYGDDLFGSAGEFATQFRQVYEGYENVPHQAAQSAAAVMVWKDAFQRANSFDVEMLRDALATTDLSTFYGGIKFSSAGNNVAKPMALRQIQNGIYQAVAPSGWALHNVNYPRGSK